MDYILLVLTLLNLGLVIVAITRINALRKDLRTPVVKKFNPDFKRRPVDIQSENSAKSSGREDKFQGNRNSQQQNRQKGGASNNRPQQVRRPAARAPEVFSNEQANAVSAPVPPRPVMESAPEGNSRNSSEGRRPLPPRFNENSQAAPAAPAISLGTAPQDLAPLAPAPISPVENNDAGQEYDRSKMSHGRRNVVQKPILDDEDGNKA